MGFVSKRFAFAGMKNDFFFFFFFFCSGNRIWPDVLRTYTFLWYFTWNDEHRANVNEDDVTWNAWDAERKGDWMLELNDHPERNSQINFQLDLIECRFAISDKRMSTASVNKSSSRCISFYQAKVPFSSKFRMFTESLPIFFNTWRINPWEFEARIKTPCMYIYILGQKGQDSLTGWRCVWIENGHSPWPWHYTRPLPCRSKR